MSLGLDGLDDQLTDTGFKQIVRGLSGGGRGPIGGGTSGLGAFGFGGGGLGSGTVSTAGGSDSALKALLRRRLRLPSTGAPSYMAAPTMTMQPLDAGPAPFPEGGTGNPFIDNGGTTPAPGGGSNRWQKGRRGGGSIIGGGGDPGGGMWGGRNPDPGPGLDLNAIAEIIKAFKDSGAFDPMPSAAIMDATRSKAMGDAQALRQRNDLRASSLGADPATAASYGLQSDLNTQGNVADIMSGTALSEMQKREGFGQDLITRYLSGLLGAAGQDSGGSDMGGILSGIGSLLTGLTGI